MLLKRVIALPGETVEFREGDLYINGSRIDEPYVAYHSDWNIGSRRIAPGHVYVIGDNRSTSPDRHKFGEIDINRIVGIVIP